MKIAKAVEGEYPVTRFASPSVKVESASRSCFRGRWASCAGSRGILLAGLLISALAACGGGVASGTNADASGAFHESTPDTEQDQGPDTEQDPGPETEPESTPETETEPESTPVISHSWTDPVGYAFTWQVYNPRISTTTNVADQQPGEALVTTTLSGDVRVTNATPNRNADAPSVTLLPIFPIDSIVCSMNSTGTVYYQNPGWDVTETGYCFLKGPSDLSLDHDLGQGESFSGSYMGMLGEYEVGSEEHIVEEAQLNAVVAELNEPAFWAIARSGGGERGVPEAESLDQRRCDAGARGGGTIVDTSDGGAGICERNVD